MQNLTLTSTNRAAIGTKISSASTANSSRKLNVTLWTLQGLLAAMFLMAGVMKLVMPVGPMAEQSGLPGDFIRFVGVCETLGGIGVILPWLLRIRPGLTPLAAVGLAGIMIGAVTVTIAQQGVASATFPFFVGLVAVFVAYGRTRLASQRSR